MELGDLYEEALKNPKTKAWMALREEAALKINPETAEWAVIYGDENDPYGILALPDEMRTIGKNVFVRSPESEIWVSADTDIHLPKAIRDELWRKRTSEGAAAKGRS